MFSKESSNDELLYDNLKKFKTDRTNLLLGERARRFFMLPISDRALIENYTSFMKLL